jgi:hypothetical protein
MVERETQDNKQAGSASPQIGKGSDMTSRTKNNLIKTIVLRRGSSFGDLTLVYLDSNNVMRVDSRDEGSHFELSVGMPALGQEITPEELVELIDRKVG